MLPIACRKGIPLLNMRIIASAVFLGALVTVGATMATVGVAAADPQSSQGSGVLAPDGNPDANGVTAARADGARISSADPDGSGINF